MLPYSDEERLAIGKEICDGIYTVQEAAEKYNVSTSATSRFKMDYAKQAGLTKLFSRSKKSISVKAIPSDKELSLEAYQKMTKEELINELIKSKANELRAKKGYEVKGDGSNKVFNSLNSKNSK
jgi:transposase